MIKLNEDLGFKSIAELRGRIVKRINECIPILNKLNEIIYEGQETSIKFIEQIKEDKNDIRLKYIKYNIDLCINFLKDIKIKTEYVIMIKTKNKECFDKLKERRDA